jgi:hypothetical protein
MGVLSSGKMNIAGKFGRWFVVVLWTLAGAFSIYNIWYGFFVARADKAVVVFSSVDVTYTLAGIAFFTGAYGLARRLRWARAFSLGLWAVFGYWNYGALSFYADIKWFPLTALALWFLALLWLMSSAARETFDEPSDEAIGRT